MKRIIEQNRTNLIDVLPLNTPFVINIDPSSACNMKCNFCFQVEDRMEHKGVMKWDLYQKIIDNIKQFDKPLKVLRLYAFGEPLLNKRFVDMVKYAKDSSISEKIDTTTNGSFFNPELNLRLIDSGINRINISVYGTNDKQFLDFTSAKIDFNKYIDNITHLYHNKKDCFIFIKINGDAVSKEDIDKFLNIFTPISDGIAIEHVMHCWNDFDPHGVEVNKDVGVYGQPRVEISVCPYIFYSFTIQYDGDASACFLDWNRRLIIGNVKNQTVKDIWIGAKLQSMREKMLRKERYTMDVCKVCDQLSAGQAENLDSHSKSLLKLYES